MGGDNAQRPGTRSTRWSSDGGGLCARAQEGTRRPRRSSARATRATPAAAGRGAAAARASTTHSRGKGQADATQDAPCLTRARLGSLQLATFDENEGEAQREGGRGGEHSAGDWRNDDSRVPRPPCPPVAPQACFHSGGPTACGRAATVLPLAAGGRTGTRTRRAFAASEEPLRAA